MGGWTEAVLKLAGGFSHGAGGLIHMMLVAAVVFLVFLSVHARGARPDAVKDPGDHKD
jgi:hypothetical protein